MTTDYVPGKAINGSNLAWVTFGVKHRKIISYEE
jgi:hypothetical protein